MAPPPSGSAPTFTLDLVSRVLDRTLCSPAGAAIIAVASFWRARGISGPALGALDHFNAPEQFKIKALLIYVIIKTANRFLNRLVRNGGLRADKPDFSFVKGKGDIIVLTGGATGLGAGMVDLFAKKTCNIAVLDLAPPTYKAQNVKYYKCDVTDPVAIKAVAVQIRSDLGEPTIIVNNAGIARGNTILNTTPEQFLLTYKVNVLGAHNMLREFLPHLIKINHGHVQTTASCASYMSIAQMSEYSCSKAAVLALHECLNAELIHRYNAPNVRTSVICPSKVSTQMGDSMAEGETQFLNPTLSAEFVSRRMVEIICSGFSDHLVAPNFAGATLPFVRAAPDWYRALLNTLGKTNQTITDAGNAVQAKTYKFVDTLDELHKLK